MVKVFYNENTLEAVARNVLCGYNKEYLNAEPQPVPIEHIIENTYGLSIEYKNITNNNRILGKTIFDDGLTPYYDTDDHEYKLMKVNSGTIII
ncbi:MAG: toxin, partial [Oscillospiraceae bacterium]